MSTSWKINKDVNGLEFLEISNKLAEAKIGLQGGHVA